MEFIDLKQQYAKLKPEILNAINQVLDSGQYILGESVFELEEKLRELTGSKHCIGVCDGSKAIMMSLMALDLKPGDEVIVPAFTFIASASMAAILGIKPVFADVDPVSYNIDPYKIEALITKNTRGIIAVSLYGQPPAIDELNLIAQKYNLFVLEDAAQSFGATYKGRQSGNLTSIATTSFFPSKPLGCYGDGGAIFTNDDELSARLKNIRIHGQDKRYHHAVLGINGRLDTLQASILLVKLKVFKSELELRNQVAIRYNELLQNVECVTPKLMPGNTSAYAQYTILVKNRDSLIQVLKQHNIPTAIHYPIPLHRQPVLQKYYNGQDLSVAEKLASEVLSLPMHPYLSLADQAEICQIIVANT